MMKNKNILDKINKNIDSMYNGMYLTYDSAGYRLWYNKPNYNKEYKVYLCNNKEPDFNTEGYKIFQYEIQNISLRIKENKIYKVKLVKISNDTIKKYPDIFTLNLMPILFRTKELCALYFDKESVVTGNIKRTNFYVPKKVIDNKLYTKAYYDGGITKCQFEII